MSNNNKYEFSNNENGQDEIFETDGKLSPEEVNENIKLLSGEAKKYMMTSYIRSMDDTVNNILTTMKDQEEEIYSISKNRGVSLIDFDVFNNDNKRHTVASLPKKKITKVAYLTPQQREVNNKVSILKQRFSVKPRGYNHLTDSVSNNETNKEMKKLISNKPFLDRTQINMEKKFFDKEIKKLQKISQDNNQIFSEPKLTDNTKNIIKQKFNDISPLYLRTKEVIKEKEERMKLLDQQIKHEKKIDNDLDLSFKKNKYNYDKERNDNWNKEILNYNKKIKEKVNQCIQTENNDEKKVSKHLYKPTINKTSDMIATYINNEESEYKNTFERLYNYKDKKQYNIENLFQELRPSFNPSLNRPAKKSKINSNLRKNRSIEEHKSLALNYSINSAYSTMRDRFSKNKSNLSQDTYRFKSIDKDEHWSSALDKLYSEKKINRKNEKKKEKDYSANLYKLNVRSASAWDKNHENKVVLKKNRMDILSILPK